MTGESDEVPRRTGIGWQKTVAWYDHPDGGGEISGKVDGKSEIFTFFGFEIIIRVTFSSELNKTIIFYLLII